MISYMRLTATTAYAPWGVEVGSKVVQVHIAMVIMLSKRLRMELL